MTFARRVYFWSGIWGIATLIPHAFRESPAILAATPSVARPEYFFGFIGVALAWQIAFLVISRDPVRFRPVMVATIVEKFTWVAATLALYAAGRLGEEMLGAGLVDAVLGSLFVAAYRKTPRRAA